MAYKSGLKRCKTCGSILTTEAYNKGFDYCSSCYYKRNDSNYSGYGGSFGLKRCKLCGEILTTEQYEKGYDYHLECYLKIKNKK